jgi:phage portal protein BeeE
MLGHWPTHGIILPSYDLAGIPNVTPASALAYTPVYRAATLISNDIARTPLSVEDETVEALIARPNRYMNGYELRRSMTMQACLYGNAFAIINRTLAGELLELIPLTLESVSLDVSGDEPFYKTSQYGDVPIASMLHIRAPSLDGLWGESPVRLCRTSLTILAAQETAQLEVMRNAGNPKLAIVHPGPLNAAARQSISEGMKVERISSTLDDAGIAAARRYSIEDVSRLFGVPTSYLSEHGANAYGTMEWLSRMYVDACLTHWYSAWSSEIEAKLAPFSTISFDSDSIARPSLAALRTGVESGVITRNEARAWLDLQPLEGLDDPIVALNMGTGGGQTNLGKDTSEDVDDFSS